MSDAPYTAAQLEVGRKLFAANVDFVKGVVAMSGLPEGDRPEIAFAGRSNVGKSSLINALLNRKNLARTSNTPGRTQELNFFDLSGKVYVVDLPGYGFAKAPKPAVEAWTKLTTAYLRGRPSLKRVFLLIDSRRGVGEVDREIMSALDAAAVVYQIVLTKADKLKASEQSTVLAKVADAVAKRPAAHPVALLTSSEKKTGLEELKAEIALLIG
ncbi:MAG: ribosome biogenesis GTP-binding protein YihA/YsxC [Pseudomonadota bacterium]